jgi:hypothetical protein
MTSCRSRRIVNQVQSTWSSERQVASANGKVLWEKSFEGSGTTFIFFDRYNIAATKTVSRLGNSRVEAFSSREFSDALANRNEIDESEAG